ncbi:MAG: hypothetical protein NVSMB59_03010 [Vulcanimicrobiaceae bacterium]
MPRTRHAVAALAIATASVAPGFARAETTAPAAAVLPATAPTALAQAAAPAAAQPAAPASSTVTPAAVAPGAVAPGAVATAPGVPLGAPDPGTPMQPPALPAVVPTSRQPSPLPTAPPGRRLAAFALAADTVAYYSNRFIVSGDGHVRLTLGDGTRIRGNTFAMDLRLNRFVVAGDVKVETGGREIAGAAFAEYFDFDRAYFVPILGEPDRWTYEAGRYDRPLLGREMPGDTFFLPDLSGERVFLTAKHATIDPRESVRFTPADINFGLARVPFPSYFLNFSPNPNFAQNALAGAYVDGPYDALGGRHALATLHLRYDPKNSVYPSIEQHQVGAHHYLVASINPLTRPLKQYNFLAYDRLSPGLQASLALQEIAFQRGFSQPLSATGYASLQITGSLPHSYLQFTTQNYYDSLLARPSTFIETPAGRSYYYGDPSHNFVPDHPSQQSIAWIGFRQPLGPLPFTFQLRSGYGAARNTISPLTSLGGVSVTSLYETSFGLNIASKAIKVLPDRTGLGRDLYLTAAFDKQRQFNSLPHFTDTQSETFALTKVVSPRRLTLLGSYSIGNTGDYWGARQSEVYPSAAAYNTFTGEVFDGFRAFRGFATTHSLVQQAVFTPNDAITLNATMRENRDFPRAVPGPPFATSTAFSGSSALGFQNYGATPYQADLDLRVRLNSLITLDIGRSYFFNFGGYQRWSPTFSFAITK